MNRQILFSFLIFLISGCSLLQRAQAPCSTPTITITGPPEINLHDVTLEQILQQVDSLNQEKIDSAGIVISDLKDQLNEQAREYEERIENIKYECDKQRDLLLEQSKAKALKKPK